MTVSVCFPYRPDEGPRDEIADWVLRRWSRCFPEFELLTGTCDPDKPFNRSQAINNAFRASTHDTIIVADLDTIFFKEAVEQAIEITERTRGWGFAFRSYFALTEECSREVMMFSETIDIPLQNTRFNAWGNENVSGVMVCPRAAFIEIGGYDEGFVGWGYEDVAFAALAEHRWGAPFRIEQGYVLHLWHPPASVYETSEINRERYENLYVNGDLDVVPRWIFPRWSE